MFENEVNKTNSLKAKLKKNSSNSGKPPASDGLRKKIQNNRESSNRFQGGQPGHKYHGLELSNTPNVVINVSTPKKCDCGGHVNLTEKKDRRQIIKLMIFAQIEEYRGDKGICECCGKEILPTFPKELSSKVIYDDSFKVFTSVLSDYCNVSLRKISEVVSSLCNVKAPAIGSICNWKSELYKKSEPIINFLKKMHNKKSCIT